MSVSCKAFLMRSVTLLRNFVFVSGLSEYYLRSIGDANRAVESELVRIFEAFLHVSFGPELTKLKQKKSQHTINEEESNEANTVKSFDGVSASELCWLRNGKIILQEV